MHYFCIRNTCYLLWESFETQIHSAFVLKIHSLLLLNAVVFLVTSGINVEQQHLISLSFHIIYAVILLGNTVMKRVYAVWVIPTRREKHPTFCLSEPLHHSYMLQTVVGKFVKTVAQIQWCLMYWLTVLHCFFFLDATELTPLNYSQNECIHFFAAV